MCARFVTQVAGWAMLTLAAEGKASPMRVRKTAKVHERENLEKAAREKARGEVQLELKSLEEELKEKGEKLKEMREAELQLRKEQRKLKEEREGMELEIARRLDRERKSLEEAIRRGLSEEFVLRQRDYEEKIRGLTEQIGELKRRAEQGSQQAQGEVLERQVEE